MPQELPSPVLVTGASGYLASWIVRDLLMRGVTVHATLRDPSIAERSEPLLGMDREFQGTLKLFQADLSSPGAFDEAAAGCKAVVHSASPVIVRGVRDPQEQLLRPAVEGTRNVLGAASRSGSVTRVVLTSSVAAIYGDAVEARSVSGGIFNESGWNMSSSLRHMPYSYSKTEAEREAWRIAETQDRWRLVVMNPAFMLGPSLVPRIDSPSVDFMLKLARGRFRFGAPDMSFGIVDVRDVSMAHVLGLSRNGAEGRHLLSAGTMSVPEMGMTLKRLVGRRFPFSGNKLPRPLIYAIAPFAGVSWRDVSRNLGYRVLFDNSKSTDELGLIYRPLEETLADHHAQLRRDGWLD